jgi:hypothetical protein
MNPWFNLKKKHIYLGKTGHPEESMNTQEGKNLLYLLCCKSLARARTLSNTFGKKKKERKKKGQRTNY